MQAYYNDWMDDDPYSSGDEISTAQRNTSRARRTDRNIAIVQDVVSTPPPPSDPQNRAFASALTTIKDDPAVKSQLERLEEIKTLGRDKVLADTMYTEVMVLIVQAAKAVSLAGTRYAGRGEREEEETEEEFTARMSARARTVGNFAWREGSASNSNTPDEASAALQPSAMDEHERRMGGERRVGGENDDYFSLKVQTRR